MIVVWKYIQSKFFAPIDLRNPVKEYLYKEGCPLWECDLISGLIVEAEFEMIPAVDTYGILCVKRKLVMKDKCIYEFAINGANAVRKFEKRITETLKKDV
jgi:hypothetical protein